MKRAIERARALVIVALAGGLGGCAEPGPLPSAPEDSQLAGPQAAPGGGNKPTATLSLSDGMVAAAQPVKVFEFDDGFRWENGTFQVAISMASTLAAGAGACEPGAYGADDETKTALLQKLSDPVRVRSFQAGATEPFPSSQGNGIVLRWVDPDGHEYFVKIGVTASGPSTSPSVSRSGDVYTYSGGTVFIHRIKDLHGKERIKRDMICPNLDTVVLTAVP